MVAKETLGVSTGKSREYRESWWWNEEVQEKIKNKNGRFNELIACTEEEVRTQMKEWYKEAKREAKKAVAKAKSHAFEAFYQKLETKEGEKYIFKLAKARSRQREDVGAVKYIKDESGRVLIRQEDIKLRWHQYFSQLLNMSRDPTQKSRQTSDTQRTQVCGSFGDITKGEVSEALQKMGRFKAVGPDNIPIEVWRSLGEEGIQWLTNLFHAILRSSRMSEEWRISTIIPLFKKKGDAQECGNYRGIKLLSHTMKIVGKSN